MTHTFWNSDDRAWPLNDCCGCPDPLLAARLADEQADMEVQRQFEIHDNVDLDSCARLWQSQYDQWLAVARRHVWTLCIFQYERTLS